MLKFPEKDLPLPEFMESHVVRSYFAGKILVQKL